MVEESGSRITRRRLLRALHGVLRRIARSCARSRRPPRSGPASTWQSFYRTPWRRGRRLVDENGRRYRAATSRPTTSTRPSPRAPTRRTSPPRSSLVRLPPGDLRLPPGLAHYAASGIVAYSKICTHAGCAISLYRTPLFDPNDPGPALVCPCHYSTFDPATGGDVLAGPAGRKLPMLPLYIDRSGGLRAAGNFDEPVGASWWGVRLPEAERMIRRLVRYVDQRSGTAPLLRKQLRYLFPDHWSFLLGEVALYAFLVLVATGTYLALFYNDSTAQVVYHGPYAPLRGQHMTEAYRSVLDISTRVKAGPADPPDPPLGRGRLPRRDRPAPAARLLHGRLPQAARGHLLDRPDACLMVALLEGFLGYSLVDDLLSGMGLAIANAVALSIPFVGSNIGALVWGGPFPGGAGFFPRMYILHVFLLPALIGAAADGAPRARRAQAPHAVQARPARDRAQARRRADVPGPGAALARPAVRGRRRPRPARRARPDQPDLAVGAVSHLLLDERRAARLVPRLADRRAAAHARLRRDDRRLHARAEPVLGRSALPAARLRAALRLAVARAARDRRRRRSTTCSTARATRRSAPRSGSAC